MPGQYVQHLRDGSTNSFHCRGAHSENCYFFEVRFLFSTFPTWHPCSNSGRTHEFNLPYPEPRPLQEDAHRNSAQVGDLNPSAQVGALSPNGEESVVPKWPTVTESGLSELAMVRELCFSTSFQHFPTPPSFIIPHAVYPLQLSADFLRSCFMTNTHAFLFYDVSLHGRWGPLDVRKIYVAAPLTISTIGKHLQKKKKNMPPEVRS